MPEGAPAIIPTFTTKRLGIRQLDRSDAEAIFALQSDRRVTEPYCQEPYKTIGETRKWLEERVSERGRSESTYWVLTPPGQDTAIGSCCLWNFDWKSRRAELGYELRPDHWGKGIMGEAIRPILNYGFTDLGLHRIEACPFGANSASNRLLLRLGFRYEGNLGQRHLFRGRYFDQLWYGLLKEEWEAGPTGTLSSC
jgi:[ribosomal protein S5]-alanine N-acetyltransferase